VNVLLLQLDGKIPNLALMRISAHHKALGDSVELRIAGNAAALERQLWDTAPDMVYASSIFGWTRHLGERLLSLYPQAKVGGSGWDTPEHVTSLAEIGITTRATDYSIYPKWQHSIGFTQRGCRMNADKCPFCSVPWREGKIRAEDSVISIWRGDPHPKNLLLLDNDTFGNPNWRQEIAAIRDGGFKVCWNQGINARLLNKDEFCEAIASVNYRDDSFTAKRLYTAWDNLKDEAPLFRGLDALVRYGVKPDNIMVYLLCGFGESADDREYRRKKLRDFGARPYPMVFDRQFNPKRHELNGFARWVIGAYDKRVPWDKWEAAGYEPRRLGFDTGGTLW
jgi:hypothetical protein